MARVLGRHELPRVEELWIEDREWSLIRASLCEMSLERYIFHGWLPNRRRTYANSYRFEFEADEYDISWRCWDDEPTPREMRQAAWKEQRR